jgi:hypothetical protein
MWRRTAQMETTEKSMNVIYAGYSLAVTHNINQPPMPTADKNDQPRSDL